MKEKSIKNLTKFSISTVNMSSVKGGISWGGLIGGGSRPMRPTTNSIGNWHIDRP